MENADFAKPLKETIEDLRSYIDELVGYNKLIFTKKIGELASYLTLLIALGFLSTLVLIFLSFGFVWWYSGTEIGERYIGFLIVAGFYVFIALILAGFREKLIFKPIRKAFGNVIFSDVNDNTKNEVFANSEMLDVRIQNAKDILQETEKKLNGTIANLGKNYTLSSISKQLFQNAYNSMMTTSNIAKLAFTLIQKIQKRKSKKSIKDDKKRLND